MGATSWLIPGRYETPVVSECRLPPQALAGVEVDVGALFSGA